MIHRTERLILSLSLRCGALNYEITKHLDFTVTNVKDYNRVKVYGTVYVYK